MMNFKSIYVAATISLLATAQQVAALEVDREVLPRTTLGGRVIATVDAVDLDSEPTKENEINLDDSSVLMRFDKRMYENGVAGAVVGFRDVEDSLRFHQLFAFYWNQDFNAELGMTKLRNSIVEFPIIRDEDLLSYTHVGNASSNEEFDQLYGKQLAFDWFIDKKIQKIGVWTGTLGNGETPPSDAPDGFDYYGAGYIYEQPEDLRYVKWIRHAGLIYNSQKVRVGGSDEWMGAWIAGIELNLNMNPVNNWSLGLQAISNEGAGPITAADINYTNPDPIIANQARAKYNSLVVDFRYTGRPMLLTRWQAAVTAAYKDYSDVNDAKQWSIVPNVVYKLGQGVDLLAQYKYTDYGNGLGGGSDNTFQVGVSFSLEAMYNDNIGERDSIINLEHGYIKK
jgi:hypothetical protein